MVVIKFGTWCSKGTSLFIYHRIYADGVGEKPLPLCTVEWRYVDGRRRAKRMEDTESAIELLSEMRINCEQGKIYDDPKRKDKIKALEMAIIALMSC